MMPRSVQRLEALSASDRSSAGRGYRCGSRSNRERRPRPCPADGGFISDPWAKLRDPRRQLVPEANPRLDLRLPVSPLRSVASAVTADPALTLGGDSFKDAQGVTEAGRFEVELGESLFVLD